MVDPVRWLFLLLISSFLLSVCLLGIGWSICQRSGNLQGGALGHIYPYI